MKHTYNISGMTCGNCQAKVQSSLEAIEGITAVEVNLAKGTASIEMNKHIDTSILQQGLPDKYTIQDKDVYMPTSGFEEMTKPSKLKQLKPLFIILGYIAAATVLIHRNHLNIQEMMLDYMGLFFIVFSFFKMLDIAGFASTFSMYDPVAQRVPLYGKVYPFLETLLGILLLMRIEVNIALIATIIILGFTTYGVTKTLLSKRAIKCACLGTALDLPMTEATFIENAIMIIMSVAMLFVM